MLNAHPMLEKYKLTAAARVPLVVYHGGSDETFKRVRERVGVRIDSAADRALVADALTFKPVKHLVERFDIESY